MKAVLHNLLEGSPCAIFLSEIRVYANGNCIRRATVADPDPTSAVNMVIMAEPLKSPENTSCDIVQLVINDIIKSMMPRHALSRVRRYLARQCIKPRDMDVRSYFQRLAFINTQELPLLPPFERGQTFTDNELKEILLFATLPEWQREMDQIGFDLTPHDSACVLNFMKNVEAAETSISVGTGVCCLLLRFGTHVREASRCNTNP